MHTAQTVLACEHMRSQSHDIAGGTPQSRFRPAEAASPLPVMPTGPGPGLPLPAPAALHYDQRTLPDRGTARTPDDAIGQGTSEESHTLVNGTASTAEGAEAHEFPPVKLAPPLEDPAHEEALPKIARLLARLHAGLLRAWPPLSLAAETNLLVQLLAVPHTLACTRAARPSTVLCCARTAAAYSLAVLANAGASSGSWLSALNIFLMDPPRAHAGSLLASLGVGVLEALQQHPSAQANTTLRAVIDEALQLSRDVPVPALPGRQALHSDFNLTTYTSDGIAKRTPASFMQIWKRSLFHANFIVNCKLCAQIEQRRVTNREMYRDEWLALLRDASAASNPFAVQPASSFGRGGEIVQ